MNVSAADPQKLIYHEKQEGRLCAVHCLNNLFQESYFTAVDLGGIADQLDEEERHRMAEGGFDGEDYRRFIASPSSNKDDTGYFSLQVIQKALNNFSLEMIPFNSKSSNRAICLRANPTAAQAFICHYNDHWLALRRFGVQWINLNSVLAKPKPISDTYLALYLEQLQAEGYSIYIIAGDLPQTEADAYLRENPLPEWYSKEEEKKKKKATPSPRRYRPAGQSTSSLFAQTAGSSLNDEGDELESALEESRLDAEKRQLELALQMSLQE